MEGGIWRQWTDLWKVGYGGNGLTYGGNGLTYGGWGIHLEAMECADISVHPLSGDQVHHEITVFGNVCSTKHTISSLLIYFIVMCADI